MSSEYDAEWASMAKPILDALSSRPVPAVHDVQTRRAGSKLFFGMLMSKMPTFEDVVQSTHEIVSYDGTKITLYHYKKRNQPAAPGPAVLHVHGGGMIAGEALTFAPVMAKQVAETGLQYFDVEYRLAPEHPHPAPVEDTYAALTWIIAHADELNVDPRRIGIQGESAGGGIAASVSLMARDRKLQPPLAKVILTYPMLDYRNVKPVSSVLDKHLFWTVESNITGWTALLGKDKMASDNIDPYASLAYAEDLSGLPATFIDLGGLDLFRDEDVQYAGRLIAADVPVELHIYPGVPHAFGAIAPLAAVSQFAAANKMRALKSI